MRWGWGWLMGNLLGRATPQEKKDYTIITEIKIVLLQTLWGIILSQVLTLTALYLVSYLAERFMPFPFTLWARLRWIVTYWIKWAWIPGVIIPCICSMVRMIRESNNPYYQQYKWIKDMVQILQPYQGIDETSGLPPVELTEWEDESFARLFEEE